jgi:outer membrane receptor protein involved in Fe transport
VPGFPAPSYYTVQEPAVGITPTIPPQEITVSPVIMTILQAAGQQLPRQAATYLNLGPIRNRGVEASVDHRFNRQWSAGVNYSWQDTPEPLEAASGQIPYPTQEVGIPSEHRLNASLAYTGETLFGNVSLNHASEALWMDVLNATYAGFTDGFTMVNATVGVKLAGGRVMVSLKGTNLADERIQQHVFGDVLRRSVVAELRLLAR